MHTRFTVIVFYLFVKKKSLCLTIFSIHCSTYGVIHLLISNKSSEFVLIYVHACVCDYMGMGDVHYIGSTLTPNLVFIQRTKIQKHSNLNQHV